MWGGLGGAGGGWVGGGRRVGGRAGETPATPPARAAPHRTVPDCALWPKDYGVPLHDVVHLGGGIHALGGVLLQLCGGGRGGVCVRACAGGCARGWRLAVSALPHRPPKRALTLHVTHQPPPRRRAHGRCYCCVRLAGWRAGRVCVAAAAAGSPVRAQPPPSAFLALLPPRPCARSLRWGTACEPITLRVARDCAAGL